MKKFAFKYLIALLLLFIFAGGVSLSVIPGLLNDGKWISWQKQESENDASRSENASGMEVKEFIAELPSGNFSPILAEQLAKRYWIFNFSYKRTYFLVVPTPPPDFC
jgi:hypothetical protein